MSKCDDCKHGISFECEGCIHEPGREDHFEAKAKEIRPENAGELWHSSTTGLWATYHKNRTLYFLATGDGSSNYYGGEPFHENIIHGKGDWTRRSPCVDSDKGNPEEDNVERLVFENITFQERGPGYICAINEYGAMVGCMMSPPMKMTLEWTKNCSHGKGLKDYCEPCGRINGG